MQKILLAFAKQNAEANETVLAILSRLDHSALVKDRGSYYGSLLNMARHILGGEQFFLGLFAKALETNKAALPLLSFLAGAKKADELELDALIAAQKKADRALVALLETLSANDLLAPVAIDWYGKERPSVPLYFMLQQLIAHGIHHRGQISQVLDSLKIDNNYSALSIDSLTAV
ncbi:MAG: DinB family protein [Helicobacteraceae bacterium]|jgi:uncharacterized damage-inducible protein DinB|nr:DinB family protein [Helicobacteraceae bacterium]